jgi:hypothetical protein
MRTAIFLAAVGFLGMSVPVSSRADDSCGSCERRAYGDYCRGGRCGWYGAKDPVKTLQQARERLEAFFEDEDVVVGKITEKQAYFQVEINDGDGALVDQVIIDKRTGRIRSIY